MKPNNTALIGGIESIFVRLIGTRANSACLQPVNKIKESFLFPGQNPSYILKRKQLICGEVFSCVERKSGVMCLCLTDRSDAHFLKV